MCVVERLAERELQSSADVVNVVEMWKLIGD